MLSNPQIVADKTREYIKANCIDPKPCKIAAKDMTNFEWDKFYVFEPNVEDEEIEKVIGKKIESTTYSRKWIFLKNGEIVHIERDRITDIEEPIGARDILIETTKNCVIKPDSVFKIEKDLIRSGDDVYFKLDCLNCN